MNCFCIHFGYSLYFVPIASPCIILWTINFFDCINLIFFSKEKVLKRITYLSFKVKPSIFAIEKNIVSEFENQK